MKKSRFLKIALLTLTLVMALPNLGIYAQDDMGTVADVIASSPDHTILATAVGLADSSVATTLSGEGSFTVFAPNDAAFSSLPSFIINGLTSNSELLTSILTYHVVDSKILAADIADGATEVTTLNGDVLTVTKDADGNVYVENAKVVAADLEASNGVVHVIDAMVLPTLSLPEVDPLFTEGDIITAGSSTVWPLTTRMAERFEEAGYTGTTTVDKIGSRAGFERFCDALESDISNASEAMPQDVRDRCAANGREVVEFRVGTDALAITVSNDFVDNLTLEQVRQIFSAEVTMWNEVNPDWPAIAIELYSPGTDSGTYGYFVEAIFEKDEAPLLGANPQFSEDDDVLVNGVAGSEGAIGYFGYAYYIANADILNIVNIEGVEPTGQAAESGEYPLARPLFIYSSVNILQEKTHVADFVNFYLTNVNDEIESVGYFVASEYALNLAKLSWLTVVPQE